MSIDTIVILALVIATVGGLVALERHSRRNAVKVIPKPDEEGGNSLE
jgi:hypothetical protein